MQYAITDRTTLKRLPKRGDYNHETVHSILDEGFVCHLGFNVEGRPCVIPTGYARVDETIMCMVLPQTECYVHSPQV